MADDSQSVPKMVDDELADLLGLRDDAGVRLAQSRNDDPLACALVLAALCWDRVDPRGWRVPGVLAAQARRLMAGWRLRAEDADDMERVRAALEWATRDPALLECDGHDSYRPVYEMAFPAGWRFWRERFRAAAASGVLTPLERVVKGDDDHGANSADPSVAEASYRLAVDSDDPDAAAMASLRLAELAEEREQPAPAQRQYTEVAALRHPVASPPAVLWLAYHAAQNDDVPTARDLAQQVLHSGHGSLRAQAWALLGSLAWRDEDTEAAVSALRQAVQAAGLWHMEYSRRLAEMHIGRRELADAADVYRRLLDEPLFHAPDVTRYVQIMVVAGWADEAVTVLERHPAIEGPFGGELLLALTSLHSARDDLQAAREVLTRVRAHWSVVLPQISVRAEVMDASITCAEGDDERAAGLYRALTDTDDTQRRDLARPLLIAAGEHFAQQGKLCLIRGARPLLEYLSEAAPPSTAAWAATSLAHLATVEGRANDAEAAVRLAARHHSSEEVTVLRAMLLDRAGRRKDGLAYLIDAAVTASPSTLVPMLTAIAAFGMRCAWPDEQQRRRLRAAIDHALSTAESESLRNEIAIAMAQVELYSCVNRDRAITLWQLVAGSDDPAVAAAAWHNLGHIQQWSAPITAAHAYDQAIRLGDSSVAARAAIELAQLAERLGDDPVLARACTRILELTSGDDRARASLRLGRINQYHHFDEAESAYQAAIDEPGAQPATIGAALARLGALYSLHGNRRMADRTWRRGRHHRDPRIAEAFAAERAIIGRVRRRMAR